MEQKLKDLVLQRHYEDLFSLFAMPGWAAFVSDVKRYTGSRENPRTIQSDKIEFVKGELSALDWLTAYQGMTEFAYAELLVDQGTTDALELQLEQDAKLGRATVIDNPWAEEKELFDD